MAVLRSGKKTNFTRKSILNKKKILEDFGIKECFIKLDRVSSLDRVSVPVMRKNINVSESKPNLRPRKKKSTVLSIPVKPVSEKRIVNVCQSNKIWNDLISREYTLAPGVIVLAKMTSFRPWPARINTVYRVGNTLKCFVLFYGTLQIGSVSENQCVGIEHCATYLSHAVKDIKNKNKWKLNYDDLSKSDDSNRASKIVKLTQVQKFLLAIRDIEVLRKVPIELSLTV